MLIISDYQEDEKKPSALSASSSSKSSSTKTSSFSVTFDPSNPLGFLEKAFEFVAKESDFLMKEATKKKIVAAIRAAKEKKQPQLEEVKAKKLKEEKKKKNEFPSMKMEKSPTSEP